MSSPILVKSNKSGHVNNQRSSFAAPKMTAVVNLPKQLPKHVHQTTVNNNKKSPKKNRKNKKSYEYESSSSSSSEESDTTIVIKTPKKKTKRPVVPIDYKSLVDQVYAGPTFNNSPAPSSLPLPPVFNARGSPTMLPQVMNTAYEMEQTNLALSEIQRGLRSMLKIES